MVKCVCSCLGYDLRMDDTFLFLIWAMVRRVCLWNVCSVVFIDGVII